MAYRRPESPPNKSAPQKRQSFRQRYDELESRRIELSVRLQSLGTDLLSDASPSRQLDYDLRVEWEPATDGDVPEANVRRQLVKVNGRAPREKDEPGCMDPRAVSPEPLSMSSKKNRHRPITPCSSSNR